MKNSPPVNHLDGLLNVLIIIIMILTRGLILLKNPPPCHFNLLDGLLNILIIIIIMIIARGLILLKKSFSKKLPNHLPYS